MWLFSLRKSTKHVNKSTNKRMHALLLLFEWLRGYKQPKKDLSCTLVTIRTLKTVISRKITACCLPQPSDLRDQETLVITALQLYNNREKKNITFDHSLWFLLYFISVQHNEHESFLFFPSSAAKTSSCCLLCAKQWETSGEHHLWMH